MAAPSIIENDKGTPTYISPTARQNLAARVGNKPIPVNIGTTTTGNLPMNQEYLQGYAYNRLELDAKTPEQYQYQAQSSWDAFKNGLTQLGAEAILGTVKSAATLLDLPQYVNIAMNKEKEFNTVFGDYIDELAEGVRENNPVFGTEEVELANPKFWASLLPDLGTTVSLFVPTGAAVKGLSLITKGIIGANKAGGLAGKVANHMLKNRETYKGVGAAMISRTMESSLEAEGTLKESYEKYLSEGYGDEQAKQMAGEDARNTYVANLPLVLLDAVQYTSLYKGMFNPLRGARAAERALANTTSNAILKAARGVYKAGKAVSGIAMESGEELLQFGIQKEASKTDSSVNTLLNAISNLPNYVSDPEAQKAMISGAFGGGVFEGLSYAQRKLFKKDAEIDNDLEAGRVAGAHYKSMKTFMDIIDEDRLKEEKLINEGRADQYISKADSFLEAAKLDTDSFTPEDIKDLEDLKGEYKSKLLAYTNKNYSGEQLNKIVEEDMKSSIYSRLATKLGTTAKNTQLTGNELRFRALDMLQQMEESNTDFLTTSKLNSRRILREIRKEKSDLIQKLREQTPDFDINTFNRKVKVDSNYREALTVQSNIETANILANIANANIERYENGTNLKDDITIDNILKNYKDLSEYKEKFTTPDDYIDYLDKLVADTQDEDLKLVVNTIFDDLIYESLKAGEEISPKLDSKIEKDNRPIFDFNKDNLKTNPGANYSSVITTPMPSSVANTVMTNDKAIKTGLLLEVSNVKKPTEKEPMVVLSANRKEARLFSLKDKKVITVSTDSLNNTVTKGTYRTKVIDGVNYIVAKGALIDIEKGEFIIPNNLTDNILFRRATEELFSNSSIAKIEKDRKAALSNSSMIVMDAEKLYLIGTKTIIDKKIGLLDRIINRAFKKTLGINPKLLKEGGIYTIVFSEKGNDVSRIFVYRDKELRKQIKNNNVLQDDPNYEIYNDTNSYTSFQQMAFPTKSIVDTRNINKINNDHDAKYLEALQNNDINAETAYRILEGFNPKANKGVLTALKDKYDLESINFINFEETLETKLRTNKKDDKTADQFIFDTLDSYAAETKLPENVNDLFPNDDVYLIDDGKNIPIKLLNGTTLHLTNNSGILFLVDKKTKKVKLAQMSSNNTDNDLINLSVAQAFVEKVLLIPVYDAVLINSDNTLNNQSLISLYTYDDTSFPYNSGYEFINKNVVNDSETFEEELEKVLSSYEKLTNRINTLIDKGKTTAGDLITLIKSIRISSIKFKDEIDADAKIIKYRNDLDTIVNNIKGDNVKDLLVRRESDITKEKQITLVTASAKPTDTVKEYEDVIKPTSVDEIKQVLNKLNVKQLKVNPNNSNEYIDEKTGETYKRVSTLKPGDNEFLNEKAAVRGTIIDGMLRIFVNSDNMTSNDLKDLYNNNPDKNKTDKFTDKFIEELFEIFSRVKILAIENNLELISDISTLWGVINGENYAGTIDLLGINRDTNAVYIIDLKTSTQDRTDEQGEYYSKYKESDSYQQSGYAELLRQRTGLTVKSITLFPIQTVTQNGKYNIARNNPTVINADTIERNRQEELNSESGRIVESTEIWEDGEGRLYRVDKLKNGKQRLAATNEEGQLLSVIDTYEGSVLPTLFITDGKKIKDQKVRENKIADKINAKYDAQINDLQQYEGNQIVKFTMLAEINREIFPFDAKQSTQQTTEEFTDDKQRVDKKDLDTNDYITKDGVVFEHAETTVLLTAKRTKGIFNPEDNSVTDNKNNKVRSNVNVFLKNLYNKIAAASYKAKEQIVPLILNENYSKKVIYMDNFTYNLISNPELIKKFNEAGVYMYGDLLLESYNIDNPNNKITDTNQIPREYVNKNIEGLIESKFNDGSLKAVIKKNPYTNIDDYSKSKLPKVLFKASPINLFNYILDVKGITNPNDENLKDIRKEVNKFIETFKNEGLVINELTDIVKELFSSVNDSNIQDEINNLNVQLNSKKEERVNIYKLFTLNPIEPDESNEGDTKDDDVKDEVDNFIQSDLYQSEERTPGKAYGRSSKAKIPLRAAQRWLEEFNNLQGTNYSIDELAKLHKKIDINTNVKYLYVDKYVENGDNKIKVIAYVVKDGNKIPIGLLDNIQDAISKKANYNANYIPKSLIKLINYISNQNYEPNTLVTSVSGKISNVFYSNSHTPDGGTSLGELIKNDVNFNIIKFNAKSEYSVMYTPDNKKVNTTDIINYNEVKNTPRDSAKFYIAYGLPNGQYMLIQIFENEFQYSEYELEQIFSNPNYDSLYKSIETTFNSYSKIREALEKNKDEFGKPSFVTNMIKFFEEEDKDGKKNTIYKLKNTRNIAPASYLKVKVNIGLNGYMNTNFIVKDNYISNDVVVKPDTNAEPADSFKRPRGTRGNKKRSVAKGIVTKKLSRENALNNLKRILPEGYDVKFYENLIKDGNDYLWGYVSQHIIGLSDQGRIGEEYHEAFHVVFGAFINQTERERLLGHVKNYYKSNDYTEEQLNDPEFAEELLADLYRDFALAYDNKTNKSLVDWIKDIPNAIIRFFKRLFNLETSIQRDKRQLDKFFRSISSGTFTKNSAELIKTFKASKANSNSKFNGTERAEIVKMLSSLALKDNVYDLTKPSTVLNNFESPEKSIITNINPKVDSLINVLIDNVNLVELNDTSFQYLRDIVKGLRLDLDIKYDEEGYVELVKLEDIEPTFGDVHGYLVKSFSNYGYIINETKLEDTVFDENDEILNDRTNENDDVDYEEEEVNQKEGFLTKKFMEAPHLKLRGEAKTALSLVSTGVTDIFGFDINIKYSPIEATHKFLSAFGGSISVEHLKERIKTYRNSNDSFYRELYIMLEGIVDESGEYIETPVFKDKAEMYSKLWNTLGKLSKADFNNTYVNRASSGDIVVSRVNANIDDLRSKLYKKFKDIQTSVEIIRTGNNLRLSDNELLLQKFGDSYIEEVVSNFDEYSIQNKKAIVALMNYLGYSDIDESVVIAGKEIEYYKNISLIKDFNQLVKIVKLFKDYYTMFNNAYDIEDTDAKNKAINNAINDINLKKNKEELKEVANDFPNDISSTHRTLDNELYYDWQTPNAISRLINGLKAVKEGFISTSKLFEKYNLDRLYVNLPILTNKKLVYEESNGIIYNTDGAKRDVSNYQSFDLMLELINNAQNGSFITPILSDSGRQVYVGGIDLMYEYNELLTSLLKLVLIENNRTLTEGGSNFKNYQYNKSKHYIFPELVGKLPTEIVDITKVEAKDYQDTIKEIDGLVKKNVEDLTSDLINNKLLANENKWNYNLITDIALAEMSVNDQLKLLVGNHIYNHVQITYLLLGDPAYYKNQEDLVKRAKATISPSSVINVNATFDKNTDNDYDKSRTIRVNHTMRLAVVKDLERPSINLEQLNKLGDKVKDKYDNNNITDGFTVIDDISYRDRLVAENAWSNESQEYMDYMMRGYPASKLTLEKATYKKKEGENKVDYVFRIIKQSGLRVIKPYYYNMIGYKEMVNGVERDYVVPFQKKDSEFKTSPHYGLKTINGIENPMYNSFHYDLLTTKFGYTIEQEVVVDGKVIKPHKVTYDSDNRIADVVTFESTLKSFIDKSKVLNIDDITNDKGVIELPFEYWGRQQETPEGHYNVSNTFGSQILKLVTSRIDGNKLITRRNEGNRQDKVSDIRKEYKALLKSDYERGEQKFLDSIQKDGKRDAKKLLKLLKSEIYSRRNPSQYIEALDLLGTSDDYSEMLTRLPASHPFHTEKIQNILYSIHRKAVNRLKFKSGYKLANASNVGFKTPEIVFNNPDNPKEGINYFEVYAPIHDTRLYEFVDEGSGLIPKERMGEIEARYPGILDGIVYRIPTEEKYSMYKIKIIGFIADEIGAIIMPDEITTRSGLDFDIDKMFGFFKNSVITKIDGKEYTGLTPEQYAFKTLENISKNYDKLIDDYIDQVSDNFTALKKLVEFDLASPDERTIYNNIINKIKEVNDKIDAEKTKLLNDREFQKEYSYYQAQIKSDNAKLDIMMDILSSEHTVVEQMTPGGFEDMELHALELEFIEKLSKPRLVNGIYTPYTYDEQQKELKEFNSLDKAGKQLKVKSQKSFWDITSMSNTISRMNVGKVVLGLAANYNAMSAVVDNYRITNTKISMDDDSAITINGSSLDNNVTALKDLDGKYKHEGTGMVVAASADNGKVSTLQPLGINFDTFNIYIGLYGYGIPRRTIEKILKVYIKYPTFINTNPEIESDGDYNITDDRLNDALLWNNSTELTPNILSLLDAIDTLILGKWKGLKREGGAAQEGMRLARLFKRLKYGDNGLAKDFYENANILNDVDRYIKQLEKDGDTEMLYIIKDVELFSNISRFKMYEGFYQIANVLGIPHHLKTVFSRYSIKDEYTKKFYYAIYSYLHKKHVDEFKSPNTTSQIGRLSKEQDVKDTFRYKINRINNAMSYLRDFKKAYPQNVFLEQLDISSYKMKFTEKRKKDENLIQSTMDDFQALLDSNEIIEVVDSYNPDRLIKISTSDFARDLAYYTIQAYGFTYNYESFSYLIPPSYYDDTIENYTSNITNLFKRTIVNESVLNSIYIEFLMNNPEVIMDNYALSDKSAFYNTYIDDITDYTDRMIDEFNQYGIVTYQSPNYNNAIKTHNDTILSLPRKTDIKYPAHFYYEMKDESEQIYIKSSPFVKIDETNDTVKYIIVDKSVNINKLFDYVTDLHSRLPDERFKNEYIDFSIYSSFFPKSHFADIKSSLNIPVVKSRSTPISKLDKTFKVVERVNNINIYRLLNKEFDRNNSMFVKALFDASDKYNMSVLDIINNTYGIEDIYNEPILKSDSSGVGVKLIYNPEEKGLSIYESNTIDDNNPTTIGDVVKLLNDTIKFEDVLSELNDEYKNKLIYATSALGKTTIANTTKNVIDSDNLKLQVIFEDYPNFIMERNEKVQAFIYRVSGKVDTISLNTKVFNKIKEKLNQGYTVLTATPAFMRNADYVFTTDINNERLLSRFKTIEEVESFLAKESEAIAKSGKSVQYVTNLEDVLVKKPEVEQTEPRTNTGIKVREEIQPGFFNYGLLDSSDEKIILDAAIKQTNEQGYPVKKGVVYAHWGNMWAVTDKGADAFSVFGQYLKRSKETTGFGKNLPKIDLPSSNINHNDGGKGWYDYYPTDQNGKPLKKIPQEIKDILQKKLGIDMSVYDSAIINSYGEITELTRHIDNTEDKGFAYKIPIVSISLIGDSLFWYSKPSNNPSHPLPDKEKIGLKPGQVVVFGGPSRAMAHRVENGKSRNSIDIKNSVNQLKTERINITLRRALPLSEEEYNNWVNNNKTMSNVNQQVEVETPIQQIYSQLGNKTQSENVVIVNIKTKDGKYDRDANFKEAKANNRIYSMEMDSDLSFSNPWASFERKGTIKTNTTKEAVINYIDWLTTDKFKNVKPERRKWILDILKSGQLKNRPIQYYAELKEPSHTTALDYLINKYDWNKQSESQTTETRELIYKDKDKRILVEYPTEIKVPEINYVFNTNKLLEILKVFSVEDDGTAEDGREFDEEILDEYGMTDSQYQYALKNQKVLSYLLNAMNEEVFVDSEGNAIYFNGFNDIIIEILKRNEKLIDTKQLTLKFPDFDKGSAFEGKDDCLIKK
jgi:alkylated DNA repair dioxygenase AlkB